MLFYQFLVARDPQAPVLQPAAKEAQVMLRVDADVESSTYAAVRYLHELGWRITGVRRAQQADAAEEFSGDSRLLELYQDAAEHGMACTFTGQRQDVSAHRREAVQAH